MEAEDALLDPAEVPELALLPAVTHADTLTESVPDSQRMQALRRGLAVGRVYYFVMFVGLASLGAYLNVYFTERGITPTQLGIIGALTAIVGLIATPLWSGAADARQWHRVLMLVATVATGIIALAYLGIAGFMGAVVVTLVHATVRAPIPVVLDTSVIALAVKSGASYPRQRVWGTVGYAAGGMIASWLVVRFGFSSIVWLQLVAFTLICTVLTLLLPIERSTDKVEYWQGLRVLSRSRPYRGLVVFMLALGIYSSITFGYGVLHIFSLGGAPLLVSLMFLLVGIFEIIGFLISDYAIRRVGLRNVLIISGPSMAMLLALAAVSQSALLFVGFSAVAGVFTGCIWAAATPLAVGDAPAHLKATAVGIILAAFLGAGFAIGSLLGGMALDFFGGGSPFMVGAAFLLAGSGYYYFASGKRQDAGTAP